MHVGIATREMLLVDASLARARQKIAPLHCFAGQPVANALEALQNELRTTPPLWLRRIKQHSRRYIWPKSKSTSADSSSPR